MVLIGLIQRPPVNFDERVAKGPGSLPPSGGTYCESEAGRKIRCIRDDGTQNLYSGGALTANVDAARSTEEVALFTYQQTVLAALKRSRMHSPAWWRRRRATRRLPRNSQMIAGRCTRHDSVMKQAKWDCFRCSRINDNSTRLRTYK